VEAFLETIHKEYIFGVNLLPSSGKQQPTEYVQLKHF